MRDPRRLLEGDASELEQRLLSLAQGEHAPHEAVQRLATQLGLSGAGLGFDAFDPAPGAASAGASSVVPPALLSTGTGLLHSWAGKLLLVSLLGGAGGAAWLSQRPAAAPNDRSVSVAPSQPAAAVRDSNPGIQSVREAPEQLPSPAGPRARLDRDGQASALSREVAALAAVRAQLKTGAGRAALDALDAYARERAQPVLDQEATALRIEALLALREEKAARALADDFLHAHPDSPHLARVRALLRGLSRARTGER
jgi:hypothetical protein